MSRPDDWMVQVELVEEPDVAVARVGEPGDSCPADDDDGSRPVRRRHVRRVVVGGLVASVVVVVAVSTTLSNGDPAPGRYDHPLAERWNLPRGTVLGVADGVVAVLAETTVAGRAEADGRPLWERSLGIGIDSCTTAVTTDPGTLWCWREPTDEGSTPQGRPASIVAVALDDGSLTDRGTPPADLVAVGGDVVVAVRDGSTAVLERRDGSTWERRWTRELPLLPNPGTGAYGVRLEAVAGAVVVHGPTTAVVDADDGTLLGSWSPSDSRVLGIDGADVVVTPAGFAVSTRLRHGVRLPEGVWYDTGGRELTGYSGVPAEPAASDGSEPGVLLVARDGERLLAAVDVTTGADLWTVALASGGGVVLRHDGSVVVAVSDSTLRCVDLLTGTERWSARVDGVRGAAGALSDGSVVVVLAVQERYWMLDALDVRTGRLAWFARAPGTPRLDELFWAEGAPELGMLGDAAVVRATGAVTWLG